MPSPPNQNILLGYYLKLAEGPNIAPEIFFVYVTPQLPMSVDKIFSPFDPAVWLPIGNIYTNVLFYLIDIKEREINCN